MDDDVAVEGEDALGRGLAGGRAGEGEESCEEEAEGSREEGTVSVGAQFHSAQKVRAR